LPWGALAIEVDSALLDGAGSDVARLLLQLLRPHASNNPAKPRLKYRPNRFQNLIAPAISCATQPSTKQHSPKNRPKNRYDKRLNIHHMGGH
jgi:hypothetical protein